jgi:hypothetical protein
MKSRFKSNKFLDTIGMFLLPYHWAYKHGFVDGMNKTDYFKGYADGQMQTHEFYAEHIKKYFKNKI